MIRMIRSSFHNRLDIENSKKCACFHCKKFLKPKNVTFLEEPAGGIDTGICPHCGYDTIITKEVVNASGIRFTKHFIKKINTYISKNKEIFEKEEKNRLGKEM